jgi:hypothetical protein
MTAVEVEPLTVTAVCEVGQHPRCRGQVLSIATGDRDCACICHQGSATQ